MQNEIQTLAKTCAALCRIECNGTIAEVPMEGDFDALFDLIKVEGWSGFKEMPDWKEVEEIFTKAYLEPLDVHEDIKSRRLALDITQGELGVKTGFTQAQISHWESGYRTPSVEQLEALAKVLGSFVIG